MSDGARLIRSFHDGYLRGVFVEDGTAIISIKSVSGELFDLTLYGVEALHADEFRQGNIIYDTEIYNGARPPLIDLTERLERLFIPPHPKASSEHQGKYAEFQRGVLARIENGAASSLNITSSYGCDLVAVFHRFILTERSADINNAD